MLRSLMSFCLSRRPLALVPDAAAETGEFPRTFGNYLLLSPLGQGGMGDVYLGKIGGIAGIEKHCVLKTLRPQFTDDREYVSRFIDEARVVPAHERTVRQ
jgi:serine/threonine protein kinase